ncbi:MAG: GTP-binding protein, partial [Woeseiaceae bacterium]
QELENFSDDLINKTRWLIINKTDLLPQEEMHTICEDFIKELNWKGPVFQISAITGDGVDELGKAIMLELDSLDVE